MSDQESETDFDLFMIILPVISALLADNDVPKQPLLKALHVWSRPSDSSIQLSLTERVNVLSSIRKRAREDRQFDEALVSNAAVRISARGNDFRSSRVF